MTPVNPAAWLSLRAKCAQISKKWGWSLHLFSLLDWSCAVSTPGGQNAKETPHVGQCSWHLQVGKAVSNPGSTFKSRDITLPTKVHLVKAMVFPVVMYGCESWTIRKAEYWRIDAFELWCWRRFLRVPWTTRRSNQSILKEISPECSLEGLMVKLKLQYFGHLMGRVKTHWKRPWCWERLRTRGKGDDRGWEGWMASPIQRTQVWANSWSLVCCNPWGGKKSDTTERLNRDHWGQNIWGARIQLRQPGATHFLFPRDTIWHLPT